MTPRSPSAGRPAGWRSVFLRALLPRLLLAVAFSAAGYLGSGGDPEIYHLFGVLLKDMVTNPGGASLDAVIARWGYTNPESVEDKYWAPAAVIETGEFDSLVNTTYPIIALHALAYAVWEHPFAFVALTSVVSAAATATFSTAFALTRSQSRWLVWNPVSIFYAATHYKESLAESLLAVFYALLVGRGRRRASLLPGIVLSAFRVTYAPFVVGLLASARVRAIDTRVAIVALMGAFVVLPPLWWDMIPADPGPIYALVHASDWTRKVIGPMVGLIQPVPVLAAPLTSPEGVFLAVYGCVHLWLLGTVLIHAAVFRRPNPHVTVALAAALVLGYYVLGGAASKARFFAPFMPILILGYLQCREPVRRCLSRALLGAPGTGHAGTAP